MGSIRRGAIRIGLELIQSLSSKPVAPSVRDDLEGRVLEKLNNPYINREGVPLAMDIFKPIGEEYEGRELPVIVAIHGGGLVTGDRKISLDLSRELALRGYLVFSIEYRLSPRANVCEQFDDICAGMDLVGRKLIEYEVDYSRVFLTADSAGAFLAIYTAAMKKSRKLQDAIGYKPSHMTFKAIGLSCGMFYTSRDDILGALLSEQFYGDKKEDAEFLQFMNPEHPEIINNLPPTFLVTSKGDFLNRYSIMYEKALKKAGKTTKLLYYGDDELKHTFNFAHPDLPQSKDANDKMLAFFEEQAQIQYARQTGRAELAKKTEAIESKIKRGTYKQQRLWKTIREMKSLDEDSLNSIAIRDEARSVTYRQMFRKWDCYAEVFSGLKMTGRSNARVGIPGAMTKEAVYAFYGLNMTGALVSMLPYAYMEDAERLAEAVREEELTDLILTDYQASPSFVKKLMEQETGLRRVIILTTEMRRAAVPQEEITKIKKRRSLLQKIPGVMLMSDLLVEYEAYPIVYGRGGDEAVILHRENEGRYEPVGFSDAVINAEVFRVAELNAEESKDTNILVGLSAEISSSYVLVNQVQITFFMGECLMIPYRTGYNKSFLSLVCRYNVNVLVLYASRLQALIDAAGKSGQWFQALNQVFLLGDDITGEQIGAFQTYFEEHGGDPGIAVMSVKMEDYTPGIHVPGELQVPAEKAGGQKKRIRTMAMPGTPYMPGVAALGGEEMKDPLVWEDKIGNSHDMRKIFVKLGTALKVGRAEAKKQGPAKNGPKGAEGDEEAAKERVMKMLAVMFDPSDIDYYYEA